MATHCSILVWRIPMGRGAWLATVHRFTNRHDQAAAIHTLVPSSAPPHAGASVPLVVSEGGGDWTSRAAPLPVSTMTLGTAWFSA